MDSLLKVSAITGGINEPSARFRVRQYIGRLARYNILVTERLPFIEKSGSYWYHKYPFALQLFPQIGTAGLRLASRVPAIINSYKSDVTLIQREFLTAFSTLEGLTKRPRIFDLDDAIWLRLNFTRGFAKKIAKRMDGLICGNEWLADYFSDCNVPTWVVPTGVDTVRWHPISKSDEKPFYLGWMGTSANYKYLYDLESVLNVICVKYPSVKVLIVSDREPSFSYLPAKFIHFVRWAEEIEIQAIQQMDVGLMPLKNSDWEKGKCSFKMLLYMAVGIPVVVSPVGMNNEVLNVGNVGFGPTNAAEWIDALTVLYEDASLRKKLGLSGRHAVEQHYSLEVLTPQLAKILKEFA
jgi:glycosyltransferase involved in cell wall biosynthesis